jgi:hypothetical protein
MLDVWQGRKFSPPRPARAPARIIRSELARRIRFKRRRFRTNQTRSYVLKKEEAGSGEPACLGLDDETGGASLVIRLKTFSLPQFTCGVVAVLFQLGMSGNDASAASAASDARSYWPKANCRRASK